MGVMLTTFCSCTVKEDRGNCPCRLMIKADSTTSISAWYGSHRLFEGLMGGVADRPVPRGTVEIVANEGDFTVPEGRQMDRPKKTQSPYWIHFPRYQPFSDYIRWKRHWPG